jgi:hypothetical protein
MPVTTMRSMDLSFLKQFRQKCAAVLRSELRKNKEIEHSRASQKMEML